MPKKANVTIDRILKGKYSMSISLKIISEIYKISVYIYICIEYLFIQDNQRKIPILAYE